MMRRLLHLLLILPLIAFTTVTQSRAQDATSPLLQILLMGAGLHQNDWGAQTNANLTKLESAIAGSTSVLLGGSDYTLSDTEARAKILVLSGTLSANVNVLVPAGRTKNWIVSNQTAGSFTVTVKPVGGAGVSVAQGLSAVIFSDGSTARAVQPDLSSYPTASAAMLKSGGTFTGGVTLTSQPTSLLGRAADNLSAFSAFNTAGTTMLGQLSFNSAGGMQWGAPGNFNVWSVDASGNTTASTVSDVLGNLRDLPQNVQGGAYTLTATDAGKIVVLAAGGATIPAGSLTASKVVSIVNDSDSSQPLTQGGGLTLRLTGQSGLTGSRTLMPRGIATIWFKSASEAYITGSIQ